MKGFKILLPLHTAESSDDEDEAGLTDTSQKKDPQPICEQHQHGQYYSPQTHKPVRATESEQEARIRHGRLRRRDLVRGVAGGDCEAVERCLGCLKGVDQQSHALFIAARTGNKMMFELLVDYDFNPSMALMHGQTPLHYAAYYGNINIVELLLRQCHAVSVRDDMGHTPLHYAADTKRDNRDMLVFLVQTFGKMCRKNVKGTTPDVVNDVSSTGTTPLLAAISRNNVDHVKCLCKLGAEPKFEDCRMAVLKKDCVILAYLVQRNAPLMQDMSPSCSTGNTTAEVIQTEHLNTWSNTQRDIILKTQSNTQTNGSGDINTSASGMSCRKHQKEQTDHSVAMRADDNHLRADDSLLRLACDIDEPHIRTEIINVLFEGGYNISKDVTWILDPELPVFTGCEGGALRQSFLEYANVRSLQRLCSLRVRHLLGASLSSSVHRLPVPEPIKDLIRLNYHTK
ncbi:ankyrin repeat and protein kinase domain-containing protein 1-like [Haliotis cracherodii]|uniref:ankyrin repeat and protein kinase domain-containing protein 1-like n=1 Tax=Haliotis cracherodii TaxID=6455 RepID=UPI0039E8BE79